MSKKIKTLVGVDIEGTYMPAVDLCKRLQFTHQSWILANAIPPIPWYVPGLYPRVLPVADSIDYLNQISKEKLEKARLQIDNPNVVEETLEGAAAASLMRFANETNADLIVLGSGNPKHGILWMLGSVSRALSIGAQQSLLVTKKLEQGVGPVHAVFATDHSEYAARAAQQLVKWAPKGFRRIDILTAYEVNPATTAMLKRDTDVDLDFENWIRDHANEQSEKLAECFKAITPETTISVEKGEPNTVIKNAMTASGADLLIVAAQGHGFFDRLMIGSTSHHQLVAEPYPVLLIRVPGNAEPSH